ncbi:MAG: M4 family metallopeptidase [Acidobacteriota bacterium]|nr:M4 family metallopeptidase [Acidobacteriota bacterium]
MKKLSLALVCALFAFMGFAQPTALKSDASVAAAARAFLRGNQNLVDNDVDYQTLSVHDGVMGKTHVRFQPILNGYPVYGQHVIVHADRHTGEMFGITGKVAEPFEQPLRKKPADPSRALIDALDHLGVGKFKLVGNMEAAYVVTRHNEAPVFTFMVEVSYETEAGPARDRLFLESVSGKLVTRHPQIHTARNRNTYDAGNGTSLPGSLARNESSSASGDTCIDNAHDYAGDTYDYFFQVHGRDSLNGNGMTLTSTVHYSSNYNNAFWNGSQMVYGDGDGSTFSCLSGDLDVVGHELTHGVTDFTADLVYSYESGALNEATSDIMAAAIESWKGASSADVWKIGEDIYTPGTPGDALRYMNDPQQGGDYDYYPTRYTGSADNGGVHWNSGIGNLFFYLLSEGGTHPRGATSNVVGAIGITKAAAIWYRALVTYMGPNTQFADARANTLQAAADLYGSGSNEYTQVGNAWTAVGVGGSGGGSGGELTSGVAESVADTTPGTMRQFYIDVPANASDLTVSISGGSGDADLYVRRGSQPTTGTYDCRPYLNGNNESCQFSSPAADRWYIGVRAYSTFSGVSVTATVTAAGGGSCGGYDSASNLSASSGNWLRYTGTVDACATSLEVAVSGGSGDADLYVRYGAEPTTSDYDCRPFKWGNNETCTISNPTAGTWHYGIRAYNTFSGLTLTEDIQ